MIPVSVLVVDQAFMDAAHHIAGQRAISRVLHDDAPLTGPDRRALLDALTRARQQQAIAAQLEREITARLGHP